MAAIKVVDFSDIVDMVMEEMKYQSGDTVSKNRIKRDVNAIYLDEVVPYKRWPWLNGHTEVIHKAFYNTDTATVTQGSATVTLATAPDVSTGSRAGYLFTTDGYQEKYIIETHTAGSATVTLSSVYTGENNSTASFKIWTDTLALPDDCRETVEVWHDFRTPPLEPVGIQEFRRRVLERPTLEYRPTIYTDYDELGAETETDRARTLKVHPSLTPADMTLHIDYIKQAEPLDVDGDEPSLPFEDRIVLVYGGLSRAWSRERNPEEAARNRLLFEQKLARMAGKIEDGFDKPQLVPDSRYISKKRGQRIRRIRRG